MSKFLTLTAGYIHAACLRNVVSNGGARSAEVPESCTSAPPFSIACAQSLACVEDRLLLTSGTSIQPAAPPPLQPATTAASHHPFNQPHFPTSGRAPQQGERGLSSTCLVLPLGGPVSLFFRGEALARFQNLRPLRSACFFGSFKGESMADRHKVAKVSPERDMVISPGDFSCSGDEGEYDCSGDEGEYDRILGAAAAPNAAAPKSKHRSLDSMSVDSMDSLSLAGQRTRRISPRPQSL